VGSQSSAAAGATGQPTPISVPAMSVARAMFDRLFRTRSVRCSPIVLTAAPPSYGVKKRPPGHSTVAADARDYRRIEELPVQLRGRVLDDAKPGGEPPGLVVGCQERARSSFAFSAITGAVNP
jgi:hypothetical protein